MPNENQNFVSLATRKCVKLENENIFIWKLLIKENEGVSLSSVHEKAL